jgi:hypothetical protein
LLVGIPECDAVLDLHLDHSELSDARWLIGVALNQHVEGLE